MVKQSFKKRIAVMIISLLTLNIVISFFLFQSPIVNNEERDENNIINPIEKLKTSAEDECNLTNDMFPIVISYRTYPSISALLHNKDYSTIRVAYYDSDEDEWQLVPYQIDEVSAPLVWYDLTSEMEQAMNGPNPTLTTQNKKGDTFFNYIPFGCSLGNGKYTHGGDEIVFYAYKGDHVAIDNWILPEFEHRIELKIVDPSDNGITWMYVYYSEESDGRPNSIVDEEWYHEYVTWDTDLLEISTEIYQLNFHPSNFDIINNINVKTSINERNLITEFEKSFQTVQISGNSPAGNTMEGTWDGRMYGYKGGTYIHLNPSTNPVRSIDTAIDDASDAYDADEGNLQFAPSFNNDISCAGDRRPCAYGAIRLILLFQSFEFSNSGTALGMDANGFTHTITSKKFYYDRMEQDRAGFEMPPIGYGLVLTVHSEYKEIFSLNIDIREEMMLHFGTQTTIEECYPDGEEDGVRGDDYYEVRGDPNAISSSGKIGPGTVNEDIADWVLLTSENDGGFWQTAGGPIRRYERDHTSSTNVRVANMYWHDSSGLTELGYEAECGAIDVGIDTAGYKKSTVFGNFKNTDNETGVALYKLFEAIEDHTIINSFIDQLKPDYPFILSIEADKSYYINGDKISLEVQCDGANYNLTADFSELDSEYTFGDEIVEELTDNYYRINYTINATHNTITPGYYDVNITADDEREENNSKTTQLALYPSNMKFINISSITSDFSLIPGNSYNLIVNISSLTNFDVSITSLSLEKRYLNDKWGNAISNITCTLPLGELPATLSGGISSVVSLNYTMKVNLNAPPGDISINASSMFTILDTEHEFEQENASNPYSGVLLDNTKPYLRKVPGNLTLINGGPNVDLGWIWVDYEPDSYNITKYDGSLSLVQPKTSWTNADPIYHKITSPSLDEFYILTINVNDTSGNVQSHNVSVNVISTSSIALSTEYDVAFIYGDFVDEVTWIASYNTGTFNYVINNGTHDIVSGNGVSNPLINFSIVNLDVGNYALNCSINNGIEWAWDLIHVNVSNDIPEITNPDDFSYITGSSGNAITWTIFDDAFDASRYYNVTFCQVGNTPAFRTTGTWNAGASFNVSVDGLSASLPSTNYNFTIHVYDGLGGFTTDSVIITVIPNDIPIVKNLGDMNIEEGDEGIQIVWTVKDKYAKNNLGSYDILIDGEVVYSGAYIASADRQKIIFQLDSLPEPLEIGNYTISISVNDGYGGIVVDEISLTVNEKVIVRIPTVIEQILEQYGFLLNFLALGYVVYLILHRRNISVNKVKLKDPIYQSKKGIMLEEKFSKKDVEQRDGLLIDSSIRQFKYATMIDPKIPEAHFNLAIVLMEKGEISEAIVELRKVIALKPDFAEAHNNLGIALALNGELDEGIASFKEALKLNPEFIEAKSNLEIALEDKDGEYWSRFGVE